MGDRELVHPLVLRVTKCGPYRPAADANKDFLNLHPGLPGDLSKHKKLIHRHLLAMIRSLSGLAWSLQSNSKTKLITTVKSESKTGNDYGTGKARLESAIRHRLRRPAVMILRWY